MSQKSTGFAVGLHYYAFPTVFGTGAIAFRQGSFPVKRILLPSREPSLMEKRMEKSGCLPAKPSTAVLKLCRNIEAFFHGVPIKTPWNLLDLKDLTRLQQNVLKTVGAIPHGETRTYGQIAIDIHRPGACRFVGTTLRKNPFPVAIPCHRVIRADGTPGSFAGGVDGTPLKIRMLTLETKQGSSGGLVAKQRQ